MLPFFSDDMLIPMLKDAKPTDVLISHFEMAGSSYLGRVSEKTTINEKLLSKWKKTYLGHYHNHHEITKDIVHLPSLRKGNFGEDNNKGFSILYNDLSYEIIKGKFREFLKIVIDLDDITVSELNELIKTHQNSSDSIRFEFTGEESKLKALDKTQFKGTGIDVKIKYDVKYDYTDSNIELPTVTERYSKSDIKKTFKQFCEDKGYNFTEGQKLLDEFLKQQ
jgi:exonuclease SbcD